MPPHLTPTERQVVRSLLGNRRTYKDLAPSLRITAGTMRQYVNRIAAKLEGTDANPTLSALAKVRAYFTGKDLAA